MDVARVQLLELKVPVESVERLTEPVGVDGLDEVSVTVTVQLVAVPVVIEPGEQATDVVVVAEGTVTLTIVGAVVAPSGEPVTSKL